MSGDGVSASLFNTYVMIYVDSITEDAMPDRQPDHLAIHPGNLPLVLTASEVADLLRVSTKTVARLCRSGAIRRVEHTRLCLVTANSVRRYLGLEAD